MSADATIVRRRFTAQPLTEVIGYLRHTLQDHDRVCICVPHPDLAAGRYAGESIEVGGATLVCRPLRTWVDLADRMGLRLFTPRATDEPAMVTLELSRLDPDKRWRYDTTVPTTERYGDGSDFQRIAKAEDPDLVLDLADALERIALPVGARVLDLGVNTGDELALVGDLLPELRPTLRFVGIDHCASAIATARTRFADPRHRFVVSDVTALGEHDLGRFDLALTLNTLHSPSIDDRAVLRRLVQDHLGERGSIIIGVPNCIYVDGEIRYGARMRNYRQPDLSVVLKEVAFYRRYLQQHRRTVFITGKYHLLITAIPVGHRAPPAAID